MRAIRWGAVAAVSVIGLGLGSLSISLSHAQSEDRLEPSASDFGGVGLLQTRTARFGPDGVLDVGVSSVYPYQRLYINMHVLPWLEATFRYTEIKNRLFSDSPSFSGFQTFKDRGADLKLKLLNERRYVPQVAIGLQDGLGTGLFGGEYVVASKRFRDLDFSLGMAWGNPGGRGSFENPFIRISEEFRTRAAKTGRGGAPSLGAYFSGARVALFGGAEYFTPLKGLTLKLEYDGNDYKSEPEGNAFIAQSPYNVGFVYRPYPWLDASAGIERGNTLMARFSLRANLHKTGLPKFDDPPVPIKSRAQAAAKETAPAAEAASANRSARPLSTAPRTESAALHSDRAFGDVRGQKATRLDPGLRYLFDGLESVGFKVESVEVSQAEARIRVVAGESGLTRRAAERAFRIVVDAAAMPVDRVTVIESLSGVETARISMAHRDVAQPTITDYLFDRLAADGFEVEEFEFSHANATVYLSSGPDDRTGAAEVRAARVVFNAVPTPVEKVTLVRRRAGREVGRFILRRGGLEHEADAVGPFDDLKAEGFEVESFEVSRLRAVFWVSVRKSVEAAAFRHVAHVVARSVPDPVNEVTLIAMRSGVEQTRLTVRRYERVASSKVSGNEPVSAAVPESASVETPEIIAARLFKNLNAQGFGVEAVHLEADQVTAFIFPSHFREVARNVGRAARVVANTVPAHIEQITIAQLLQGVESSRITIMRKDLERAVAFFGSPEEVWSNAIIEAPRSGLPPRAIRNPDRYPGASWGFGPRLRSHVGGPDQFYLYQFWFSLSATLDLAPGLRVQGRVGKNIYSNLDRITLNSNSRLPRVRSDIKEYLQQGEDNLVWLYADYVIMPMPEWYVRVAGGILEEMFGGFGAELLYRPFDSRWAIGGDLFKARQRTFEQRFKFQDYRVRTGHINMYYHWPWQNVLTSVHLGDYLAGDRGATLFLSRLYDSRVRVGAWATLTNVSSEDFGEGSFDKGFFISLPLDLFLMRSSRSGGTFAFRPLSRDGGQILSRTKSLYDLTEEGKLANIDKSWARILD